MNLEFRSVASPSGRSQVIEFRNPRTNRWEPAMTCFTAEAETAALKFYRSRYYEGWTSEKLSKSNP